MLSEITQTKTNAVQPHLYVESLKKERKKERKKESQPASLIDTEKWWLPGRWNAGRRGDVGQTVQPFQLSVSPGDLGHNTELHTGRLLRVHLKHPQDP